MTAGAVGGLPASGELPELANVHWRKRVDERALRRADHVWTLSIVAHEVPFVTTAVVLPLLGPVLAVVSVFALAFTWAIPALYAARGAGVLRPQQRGANASGNAEQRALGLLGDLVGHQARELVARTGLVVESGAFGVWVVGPAGALLVRPGGRRVQCYCVRVTDTDLPAADRVAHLLLALRADESGFATVANLTFSGACWRLARHLSPEAREGLAAAVRATRPVSAVPA
jgi:hypothetical protein